MRLSLYLDKTLEQNAALYFEKSKKAKKKLEGALLAIERSKALLEKERKKLAQNIPLKIEKPKAAKKEWYEKFRWFISSEGFLVIGGRDATTNEMILKKFTDKDDLVFHTDMAGSPFFVVKCAEPAKASGKKPTEITMKEAANATAIFSRAWKLGMTTLDVFYVSPDQVSKTPNTGEYLAKGSFVIRGKSNYLSHGKMEIALGMRKNDDGSMVVISGPISTVSAQTKEYIVLEQGREKVSDIAKLFKKQYGGEIDDIIRMLPSGEFKVKKR